MRGLASDGDNQCLTLFTGIGTDGRNHRILRHHGSEYIDAAMSELVGVTWISGINVEGGLADGIPHSVRSNGTYECGCPCQDSRT